MLGFVDKNFMLSGLSILIFSADIFFTKINENCCSLGILFGNLCNNKEKYKVSTQTSKSSKNKETSESNDKRVEEITDIQMIFKWLLWMNLIMFLRCCCLRTNRIGNWLIQQQWKKVIPQSSTICPKQHGAFSIKKRDHSRKCRYPSYVAYYLIHFLSLWVSKQFLRSHGDHCTVGHPYMQSELKNMCIW